MHDAGFRIQAEAIGRSGTIFLNNFQIHLQADKKEIICL